jgi:hypothetical protein
MRIDELRLKYSTEELLSRPGDKKLRYEMFAPLLSNLHESKVIYHERFSGIIELKKIKITPNGFFATAIPHLLIERGSRFDQYFFRENWEVGAIWSWIGLTSNNALSAYSNWRIWCEPETVKKAEELVLAKNFEEAIKFIDG